MLWLILLAIAIIVIAAALRGGSVIDYHGVAFRGLPNPNLLNEIKIAAIAALILIIVYFALKLKR